MSIETTLLGLSSDRQRYFRLVPGIKGGAGLDESALTVLRALFKFFQEFPKVEHVEAAAFKQWAALGPFAKLPDDRRNVLLLLANKLDDHVPPEMEEGMMQRLLQLQFATEMRDRILQPYSDGAEIDPVKAAQELADAYDIRMQRQSRMPLVEDSPEDLANEDLDDSGLKFRLSCLSDNMRGLRGGDFGILAARPDAGKTTILCSESAHWLKQMDALWPGEERCGIWLNNEGPGGRIKKRWYQAVLGMTTLQIAELVEQGRLEGRPLFTEAINAALGMDLRRMKFYDIHDMDSTEVERIIKLSNAGFVIFDMLDNVRWAGVTNNGGERTDQILETQYQGARNWCVKYDCIGVATSQLSVDGENNKQPGQHMLKDSKTGKQGACDFIITMGKDNADGMHRSRFINTPKNKLARPGKRGNIHAEVLFNADTAQVTDAGN